MDQGDVDVKATALREAEEEIGLDPALVSVVTVLEPFLSKVNKSCAGMIWNWKSRHLMLAFTYESSRFAYALISDYTIVEFRNEAI